MVNFLQNEEQVRLSRKSSPQSLIGNHGNDVDLAQEHMESFEDFLNSAFPECNFHKDLCTELWVDENSTFL